MTDTDVAAADREFAAWMRQNLHHAADHFGVTITGADMLGWRLLSVSAPVDEDRWLRVTTEPIEWAHGHWWTGNLDANAITGIRKPVVLDRTEWDVAETRRQRAELMTRVPGRSCSTTDALHDELAVSSTWWGELREALETLSAVPTDRVHKTQTRLDARTHQIFGETIPIRRWETVHGDLHWGNVLNPLALIDWDHWGTGPVGTDAATLYCYTQLAPATCQRVRETFADTLDSPDGRIAQLHVLARLLHRITVMGDHPELEGPLREQARKLLPDTP